MRSDRLFATSAEKNNGHPVRLPHYLVSHNSSLTPLQQGVSSRPSRCVFHQPRQWIFIFVSETNNGFPRHQICRENFSQICCPLLSAESRWRSFVEKNPSRAPRIMGRGGFHPIIAYLLSRTALRHCDEDLCPAASRASFQKINLKIFKFKSLVASRKI